MATSQASDSRGATVVSTSIAFVAIAGAFVTVRCVARAGLLRVFGIDDFLIVWAVALSATLTALIAIQQKHGLGRHFDTLAPGEFTEMLKPFWASIIVYNVAITSTKCSILCQYLRFFAKTAARKVCIVLLVILATYGVCVLIGSVLSCTPVSFFWDKGIHGGHCINLMAFWFFQASFNIISDIAIIILPIPVLKALDLPKKQKYGLIFVFTMGGFGCITSILRLHFLYVVSRSTDVTWDNVGAAAWSSVELNVAIICACLATLKPVFSLLFPTLLQSRQHGTVELRAGTDIRHETESDTKIKSRNSIHHSKLFDVEATQSSSPKTPKYSWPTSGPQDQDRNTPFAPEP